MLQWTSYSGPSPFWYVNPKSEQSLAPAIDVVAPDDVVFDGDEMDELELEPEAGAELIEDVTEDEAPVDDAPKVCELDEVTSNKDVLDDLPDGKAPEDEATDGEAPDDDAPDGEVPDDAPDDAPDDEALDVNPAVKVGPVIAIEPLPDIELLALSGVVWNMVLLLPVLLAGLMFGFNPTTLAESTPLLLRPMLTSDLR